jgi:hypothetical protein
MKDLLAIITSRSGKALSEPGTYSLGLAAHMRSHVTAIIAEIEPFNPTAHLEPDNMQGDSSQPQCRAPAVDSPAPLDHYGGLWGAPMSDLLTGNQQYCLDKAADCERKAAQARHPGRSERVSNHCRTVARGGGHARFQ